MTLPIQSDGLGALRVQIDSIDQQLLSLLNQRARVAEQVGEIAPEEPEDAACDRRDEKERPRPLHVELAARHPGQG
mgnify:CR=1 FL=1